MNKNGVLLVTEDFSPMTGGVAVFLHNICLNTRLHIKVLTLNVKSKMPDKYPFDIERIHLKKHFGFIILFIKHFGELAGRKREVVLWGDYSSGMLVSVLIKWLFGIRLAVIIHGTMFNLHMNGNSFFRLLAKFILRKCDLIFANSDYTRRKIELSGIRGQKIKVLYPGVDLRKFNSNADTSQIILKYGLSGKKILLTVARLHEHKNHAVVINSLPKIIEKFPNLLYVVAGDGPLRMNLEELSVKIGVINNVLFTGEICDDELVQFYNLCDIFIMPSKQHLESVEGFGIVFCEANACRKPVIAGISGGMPESVIDGETGILVNPENIDELTQAIMKLLLNPELAMKMGENGEKRIQKELTWERVAYRFDSEIEGITS